MMVTTQKITKPILGKFLFIYLIFYVYAQVGQLLFGGDVNYNNAVTPLWYLLNFNDYGCSMITLFHQMVVNNWFLTVD